MLNTGCVRNGDVRARPAGKLDGSELRRIGRARPASAGAARAAANASDDRGDVRRVGRFVERDVDRAVVAVAEVDPRCERGLHDRADRVAPPALRSAACRSRRRSAGGTRAAASSRSSSLRVARARALAIARQALRAVVHGVERRRCSPAAPAPCRCSTSPSRGGCAARASAATCGTRVLPCASTDTPMIRPGACRTCFSSVAKNAACGPP